MIYAGLKSSSPRPIFRSLYGQFDTVIVRILIAFVWLTLGSCAPAPPQQRSQIATTLLGKTKQELVTCAGMPLNEFVRSDATELIYYKDSPKLEESFMGAKSSIRAERPHGCRARIYLKEDRVEGIEYESVPATFAGEDHCDAIFQACAH